MRISDWSSDVCSSDLLLQPLQALLGGGDLGNAGAFVAEQELGVGPALAFLADQVGTRYADGIEENLVDAMTLVARDDRPHGDAGRFHVDQQEGNDLLRLGKIGRAQV